MLQIFEEIEEVMWKSGNGATTRAPVGAKNWYISRNTSDIDINKEIWQILTSAQLAVRFESVLYNLKYIILYYSQDQIVSNQDE